MFSISNTSSQSPPPLQVCKSCGTTDHKLSAYGQYYIENACRMILSQRNLITTLPEFFIKHIVSFCDQNTLLRLSEATRTTKLISDQARKKLCMTRPSDWYKWSKEEIRDLNPSILKNLLTRFSNITHLSFSINILSLPYDPNILLPLLEFLTTNYPALLLHVILERLPDSTKLTKKFFDAFFHPRLSSITIVTQYHLPVITSDMINSVLEKSTNLVSFTLNRFQCDDNLNIYLSDCPQLETVGLNGMWIITDTTIDQLGRCLNLRELSIDRAWNTPKLEEFLLNHKLKLEVLNLEKTNCLTTDEALHLSTKSLPDLKFFSRKLFDQNQISDKGLLQLANNCKKLTTLIFNFTNITDTGLTHFAANAPQLRKLSIFQMPQITHKGLLGLTQHCRKLEALELSDFKDLNPAVLLALAENCKSLTFLHLSYCYFQGITVIDLRNFIRSCTSLKHLDIWQCSSMDKPLMPMLKKFFPPQRNPILFEDV